MLRSRVSKNNPATEKPWQAGYGKEDALIKKTKHETYLKTYQSGFIAVPV